MRIFLISLINLYQSIISPRKGFSCAHHRMYGGHTCSNAVKEIILENGFFISIQKIKQRFKACREASSQLTNPKHQSDIPCDLPCDVGCDALDCGGGGKSGKACDTCSMPCDFWGGSDRRSRKYSRTERNLFLAGVLIFVLGISYWFYGRGITTIHVTPLSEASFASTKIWQRKKPDLRVMVKLNGRKVYSKIINDVDLVSSKKILEFKLKQVIFDYPESMELHDARLKVGGDFLVAGEILEKINQPRGRVEGKRFRYKIKRRWGF